VASDAGTSVAEGRDGLSDGNGRCRWPIRAAHRSHRRWPVASCGGSGFELEEPLTYDQRSARNSSMNFCACVSVSNREMNSSLSWFNLSMMEYLPSLPR
jgi:hypothetical protein